MSYIEDILNEVESKTPKFGFNVCLFDEYGDEKLIILEHFDKREEAEEYADEFEGETIYIYGNDNAEEAMVMDEDWSWQYENDNVKHWWNNANRSTVEEITGFSYKPYDQLSNTERHQVDTLYGNESVRISAEATGLSRDWDKEDKKTPMGYQLNDDEIDEETGFTKYPDNKYEYEDWQVGLENKTKAMEGNPYGIQKMLDKIVEGSLNNIEKKEIVEKVEDDFSMAKLLDLVADKLASKVGKKLGVENKATEYEEECHICSSITHDTKSHYDNVTESLFVKHKCPKCHKEYTTIDEVINHMFSENHGDNYKDIEDSRHNESYGSEGGRGSGRIGHVKYMLGAEADEECANCMIKTERDNGKCILCGE